MSDPQSQIDRALRAATKAGYVGNIGIVGAVSMLIYDRDAAMQEIEILKFENGKLTHDHKCQSQYIEELRHHNTEFLDMVEYAQTCAKKLQAENERLEAENRVLRHDLDELKNEPYEI